MSTQPAPAAAGSVFDIRLRLFGIRFCIEPSFWIMNALWAFIIYQYGGGPVRGISVFAYIGIWVLVSLVSVLVHELGHVITGRIFGQPGNITITGLGGQAVGEYGELATWQRMLVIIMGPGAGFLFVALIIVFDPYTTPWNFLMDWMNWQRMKLDWCIVDQIDPLWRMGGAPPIYIYSLWLLLIINLFVNIMNLIPIIPLDGGMLFKEVCCWISPSHGLKIAFGWSFVLASILTLFYLYVVLVKYREYTSVPVYFEYPFLFPELGLIMAAMMAYKCFASYRQLAIMERHSLYRERDDD